MADMYPKLFKDEEYWEEFDSSRGEWELYDALEKLPEEWAVIHSVEWHKLEEDERSKRKHIRWGEADFVIYNPHRGILVVEAKPGKIRCKDKKIYQKNRKTLEEKEITPIKQASRCKGAIKDLLEEKLSQSVYIEMMVWFSSADKRDLEGDLPFGYNLGMMLFQEDMDTPEDSLNRVFDYYHMGYRKNYDEAYAAKVVKTIVPEFKLVPSISTLAATQRRYFNRLTREQAYLMDYLEEQQVASIQGGGGTGKTMLAVEKARRLSAENDVLFLCFNRLLIDDLKARFQEELPRVTFANLGELVSQKLGRWAEEEDILEYLREFDQHDWHYKHIIVDEGQDFREEQIQALYDIAILQEGCFYIFYDKHQLVHRKDEPNWLEPVECRLVLSRNCRNTRSIAETSGVPIDYTNIKMRVDIPGKKPTFYITDTPEKSLKAIESLIKRYRDAKFEENQIVILTCTTSGESVLAWKQSLGSYKLVRSREKEGIFVTTARKFKGLESDVVIIIDVKPEIFRDEKDDGEGRRVFYVGSSRAISFLDYVALMDKEQEAEMARLLTGEECDKPRKAIGEFLKVDVQG